MKKNIVNDIQRKKAILMGLFIAKYSKRALDSFGFTTYKEAYNILGYSVKVPPNSIKLYQQEFDRFFPNGRDGWSRPIRNYCKEIMDEYKDMAFEEFQKHINAIVLDEYVDIRDIKTLTNKQRRKRTFLANRMITGKAAEEYFIMNYQNIPPFKEYILTDTTNMGCGFDYKLSLREDNYYVEVKGINERQGSILMTEKEYNMAENLLERYCLFVVSNFKEIPLHQMFFNPLYSEELQFQRRERQVKQVTFQTNIIYNHDI